MRIFATVVILIGSGLYSTGAEAQQQPRTTIQLPTISFFSGATTIKVPDRGQALIGSVKRSSMGSVSRGVPILSNLPYAGRLFGNRAYGASNSSSTLSAKVQIYDLREMDQALLEKARRDRVLKLGGAGKVRELERKQAIQKQADFITRNLGRAGAKKR